MIYFHQSFVTFANVFIPTDKDSHIIDKFRKNEYLMEYFNISSRRYLGNKYKLLDWIKSTVNENCTNVQSFFDVFSGTGSVAFAFLDKRLAVCDMMYSNYLAALCWFSPERKNDKN